jgi:hypothetical protein
MVLAMLLLKPMPVAAKSLRMKVWPQPAAKHGCEARLRALRHGRLPAPFLNPHPPTPLRVAGPSLSLRERWSALHLSLREREGPKRSLGG